MKREGIVWGVSGSLILFFLWIVHSFQQEHKVIFDKNYAESVTLKSNEEAIKRDLIFLKQHKNERDFLENKGWFQSKSRLVAGECIEDIYRS